MSDASLEDLESVRIDAEAVLAGPVAPAAGVGERIGTSRAGRELIAYRFGRGPRRVSLIAGCHADEPVGPAMLDRFAAYLAALPADAPLLADFSWFLVPHVNPDGEVRNAVWTGAERSGDLGRGYDLERYLCHVAREPPGDDVEFGFPRGDGDLGARPENCAVASFLRPGAPFSLHATFHGMAFAAGPWFLLEQGWSGRTADMRRRLRQRVAVLGYSVHDVDRRGDKGFHRIDAGFTTRPDSRAMVAHFLAAGDPATAALFRPSSMEHVRALGGDPLTLVSEMPLFLAPAAWYAGEELVRPPGIDELRRLAGDGARLRTRAVELGVRPMPIADQMRLQLAFLAVGLDAVVAADQDGDPVGSTLRA